MLLSILIFTALVVGIFGAFISSCLLASEDIDSCRSTIFFGALFLLSILCMMVHVYDPAPGAQVGILQAVDKDMWGKSAVYILPPSGYGEYDKYCLDASQYELHAQLLQAVGKKIKIEYGTREGFFGWSQCKEAPIDAFSVEEE